MQEELRPEQELRPELRQQLQPVLDHKDSVDEESPANKPAAEIEVVTLKPNSVLEVNVTLQKQSPFYQLPMKRKMAESVNCGSQICEYSMIFQENCHMYINGSNPSCSIPCFMDKCKMVIRENIYCPTWTCETSSSTTSSTAAPPLSTTTSPPKSSSCATDAVCISSLSTNAVMIVAVALLLGFVIKLRSRPAQSLSRQTTQSDVEAQSAQPPREEELQDLTHTPTLPEPVL